MYKPVGGSPPLRPPEAPPPRNRDRLPGKAQKCQFPSIFDRFYKVSRTSPPLELSFQGGNSPPEFAVFHRFYKVFQDFPPPWSCHPHDSPHRPKRCFTNGFQAFPGLPPPWSSTSGGWWIRQNAVLLTVSQLFGIAGKKSRGGMPEMYSFPQGF